MELKQIVLIGAGNVASHMAIALKSKGFEIKQIYSRTRLSAMELANQVNAEYTTDISRVNLMGDLYIISISDSAVEEIISQLHFRGKTVIHTSGTLPVSILKHISENYGAVYIPQTFVKGIPLSYESLNICIEASNELTEENLQHVFGKISSHIQLVTETQRKAIHLASVFVSNFSNCLYWIAEDIVSKEGISIQTLIPLIEETAKKPGYGNLKRLQTGPAKRRDLNVIEVQKRMLEEKKDYQKLYTIFTEIIMNNDI